jgi:hypothetical protein
MTGEQYIATTNKEFMVPAEPCYVRGRKQFEQFIR